MKRIVIFFADGFEEIEAVTPIDILRRAGCEVTLAGLSSTMVTGAHGISIKMDTLIAELETKEFDLVILPGGLPGATHLAASETVRQILVSMLKLNKKVAAICAGPWILEAAQLLDQRKFTCYPGCEEKITNGYFTGRSVEVDGNIITSRGVSTALAFSFQILEELGLIKESADLQQATLMEQMR